MYRLLCCVSIAVLLCACSAPAVRDATLRDPACLTLDPNQELLAGLAREMVDEGRLHAALASLEQLPASLPEARLRKARILRQLGHPEALNLYRSLLDTCLEAAAQHGLGQIAAEWADYREAAGHLRIAARLAPADGSIRNDLGLVYLHLRRLPEAKFELMTALELDETDPRPVENLLTLLIYQGNWKQASALLEHKGLSPQQFQKAEARARKMQEEDRAQHTGTTR